MRGVAQGSVFCMLELFQITFRSDILKTAPKHPNTPQSQPHSIIRLIAVPFLIHLIDHHQLEI